MNKLFIKKSPIRKELKILFFMQLFVAITYSIIYSTLIFYTTKFLKISDEMSLNIVANFLAYNYILHLLGGYIGGNILSYRSSYGISLLAIISGIFIISLGSIQSLYWGLAFFLVGAGTAVTCFNCMVTQICSDNYIQRERVFINIYAGMNIGILTGFILSGFFWLLKDFKALFFVGSSGALIALLIWLKQWKSFPDKETFFANQSLAKQKNLRRVGIAALILLILLLHEFFQFVNLSRYLLLSLGSAALCYILGLSLFSRYKAERNKLFAYMMLLLAALLFWSLYLIAPMELNLFIARNVDRHILSFTIAPQWIQAFNTIGIILGAGVLIKILKYFRNKKIIISAPLLFGCSLLLISIAFFALVIGIHFADSQGHIKLGWLIVHSLFYSFSELLIGPIGYALIGQLAPARLQSIMMGTWIMVTGLAAILTNSCAQMFLNNHLSTQPLQTNGTYSQLFMLFAGIAAIISIFLFASKKFFHKLANLSST